MGSKIRQQFSNAHYHIYSRGVDHRKIFIDDHDCDTFLKIFNNISKRKSSLVYAFCLMTNHFHLYLATPEANIDELMRDSLSKYVKYFNQKYERTGHLFESRYQDKIVFDPIYSLLLLKYIHMNPVAAQMVEKPEDWEWSSYKLYLNNETRYGLLNNNKIMSNFTSMESFVAFHLQDQTPIYNEYFSKIAFQ